MNQPRTAGPRRTRYLPTSTCRARSVPSVAGGPQPNRVSWALRGSRCLSGKQETALVLRRVCLTIHGPRVAARDCGTTTIPTSVSSDPRRFGASHGLPVWARRANVAHASRCHSTWGRCALGCRPRRPANLKLSPRGSALRPKALRAGPLYGHRLARRLTPCISSCWRVARRLGDPPQERTHRRCSRWK